MAVFKYHAFYWIARVVTIYWHCGLGYYVLRRLVLQTVIGLLLKEDFLKWNKVNFPLKSSSHLYNTIYEVSLESLRFMEHGSPFNECKWFTELSKVQLITFRSLIL